MQGFRKNERQLEPAQSGMSWEEGKSTVGEKTSTAPL